MTVLRDSDVAIVGMAGRFPASPDLETFWRNLHDGVECIRRFSEEELREAGIDPELLANPRYVRASGMLAGIDEFDAGLFGFSPREAEVTDPQQRLFLECAWEALETAGCDPTRYPGKIGIYGGTKVSTYWLHLASNPALRSSVGSARIIHGNDKDFLASWVAYRLDLRGPAVTVQTACSTSLVAVHLACQALLHGDCDLALAGGVAAVAQSVSGYLYQEDGILSPDGHCRAFDARAQGTVGGDGVGLVVLKRAAEALADGDSIRALIRGSAVNNDGRLKVGFTAPSVEGQAAVISEALAVAEVDPATVGYVEAHGTATALGDPVEIAALNRAFGTGGRCAVGSVKTNLGHLDAAAGVAGLIKTVLALEHGEIPPSLHFERPSPQIEFDRGPFRVAAARQAWPSAGHPRRAGVSSFGIGGTNAHVVLEEAPPPGPANPGRGAHVLVVSAQTSTALDAACGRLAEHLRQGSGDRLADVAYTLQVGRRALEHRRAVVAREAVEAAVALECAGAARWTSRARPGHRPAAFLFPGQGIEDPGLVSEVYAGEPAFRTAFDRCAELLKPRLGLDPGDLLGGAAEREDRPPRPERAQAVLFAVEYSLARMWERWGVEPAALLGHSLGEYVAACLAGVLSLDHALRLVVARGRLVGELPAGAMLAVPLPEERARALLGEGLSLAAVNGEERVTVAGPEAAVAALERRLAGEGVAARRLAVSHAFHSAAMDPLLERFRAEVEAVELRPPSRRLASCVTGGWAGAEVAEPGHWVRHFRETVRFADAVSTVAAVPGVVFLDVGPGRTLFPLVRRRLGETGRGSVVAAFPEAGGAGTAERGLAEAVARLWLAGVGIDWTGYHEHRERRRVLLPTYPFERRRYWIEPGTPRPRTAARRGPTDRFWSPGWKSSWGTTRRRDLAARWLVFAGRSRLSEELTSLLEAAGGRVSAVRSGDAFEATADGGFRIRPQSPADHAELLRVLRQSGSEPERILHLWSVEPGIAGADETFGELRALFGALAEAHTAEGVVADVITAGIHAVIGDERVDPKRALLFGPCRSAAFEVPGVRVRTIEVDPASETAPGLAQRLVAELARELDEPEVVLRRTRRWIPGFDPCTLEPPGVEPPRIRRGGAYLITGGLGGIGLTLAEHLASRYAARLVLVGRTPLPPRGEWANRADDGSAPEAERTRLRKLLAIEELGGEVMVGAADAADEAAMRAVIEEARRRFGRIDGAVHAAGVPGGGVMALQSRAQAAAVLAPKVGGAEVLASLLTPHGPDFLVLCSSLTAVLGAAGQAAYTGANAFLDAFALERHRAGERPATISIGWCAWRDVGMAAAAADGVVDGISPSEGVDAFERALASGRPHLIVTPEELPALLERRRREAAAQGHPTPLRARHARPELDRSYVAPRDGIEEEIAEVWGDLLGIERIGVHDDFADLGGDSLLGLQVLSRLRDRFGIDLALRDFYEGATVAELAVAVAARQVAESAGADADGILEEIRRLSAEEVRAQLGAERPSEEGGAG